ncbi:MAG: autotransporter domain-containing protein [Rhodoplanes sp.]|uniref:autotransporter domain-containing protein n=1 Tax=Rhodoplanes sp. TaxID=1968906 RepID=UPI0017FB8A21|nr:autotransporter domain-containing protein [Rhodoplanes sp.]NVO16012.1 autotransporter domain-containing protein [Rhodoplanes sp.]
MTARSSARLLRRFVASAVLASAPLSECFSDEFTGLGSLVAPFPTYAVSLSWDGTAVAGWGQTTSSITTGTHAILWTAGAGITDLGVAPGWQLSVSYAISGDGRTIVGHSVFPGVAAFRWTAATGVVNLGYLPGGNSSEAYGVNYDGSVVVGSSSTATSSNTAYRWTAATGMTGLGMLPGDTQSRAFATSADGSVIVGDSSGAVAGHGQAFRWTAATGMVGLGTLPGHIYSGASGVSADGSAVVGSSFGAAATQRAFFWTAASGMRDLGVLPGMNVSSATAISGNGVVVVGSSGIYNTSTSQAFMWTQTVGMQSIAQLLQTNGVNLGSWKLTDAVGVSFDGSVIVGNGIDPNNIQQPWIARFSPKFGSGLITADSVARSFAGLSAIATIGNDYVGSTLNAVSNLLTQHFGTAKNDGKSTEVFVTGFYDFDPAGVGSIGVKRNLPSDHMVGASAGAAAIKNNWTDGGSASMQGGTANIFAARIPEHGLQWTAIATGTLLEADVKRGYLNGSAITVSDGTTGGRSYGALGRIGWTFGPFDTVRVTPFGSLAIARTEFSGWTEGTGPFPAVIADIHDTARTLRSGADGRYLFGPEKWVWASAAWAHRLNASAETVSGQLIDLFGLTVPGAQISRERMELAGGVRLPWGEASAFSVSAGVSTWSSQTTAYNVQVNASSRF